MSSPASQFSAKLVSKMSTAIGVSRVKSCQPASASYQVISAVQPPITILTRKPPESTENIVEQKVETVTSLSALPPLPSKRWEIQPSVKLPAVNISETNSTQT